MVTIWSLHDAKTYHVHSDGLAQWLVNNLPLRHPVIDFGCGLGKYVKALTSEDFCAYGYEGTPGIKQIAVSPNVYEYDITIPMGNLGPLHTSLCIEVMEHLLPTQEDAALQNITANCNLLILSWAVEGQAGHGHNNCRNAEYVFAKLKKYGFKPDVALTTSAREAAAGTDPYMQFFRQSLYVFKPL